MGAPIGRAAHDGESTVLTKALNMELDSVIRSELDDVLVMEAES